MNNLYNQQEGANNHVAPSFEKKSENFRKCIACGKLIQRNNMIRILKEFQTGEIITNPDSKQFGRSAYLCYNSECIKMAFKKKRFQKALRSQIPDDFEKIIYTLLT